VGGVASRYRPGYCGRCSDWLQVGILWAVKRLVTVQDIVAVYRLVTGRDIVGGVATGYNSGYCGLCSYSLQAGILGRYSDWLQVGILWAV